MLQVAASMHDNTLRQVRRVAEKEEETEADVLGLLEFRECEMRQLELSLGESGTAGVQMGDNRASIAGPGAELLHSAPDMAELRSLLKELGQIARKHGTAQTELSQQQQRTRDLAHRLQQLEDESAQHQNSEAMALAEFRTRHEEELHYSSELHERSHSQSMPPAAGTAATSGAEVPKGADREAAELQTRLVSLRSRAATMLKEENEATTKLAKMQQEENEAAAKLSKLQQEENQAATRLSETQQEENQAATRLSETQQEENQAATRLSETQQAISKAQEAQAQARLKSQAVKEKATSKVEEAMSANEPKKQHERLGKAEAESSKKGHQKVAEEQAQLNVNCSEATSQKKEENQAARLSETLKVIAKAEAATDLASAKEHAKHRCNMSCCWHAEEQAQLNVNCSEATSQKKGEKPTAAKRFEIPKASSKEPAKGQHQLEVKAEAQMAQPTKEDQDADAAKNNKALLRKLRQQLAEEERKLRSALKRLET
eukprot:s3315_g6.t3